MLGLLSHWLIHWFLDSFWECNSLVAVRNETLSTGWSDTWVCLRPCADEGPLSWIPWGRIYWSRCCQCCTWESAGRGRTLRLGGSSGPHSLKKQMRRKVCEVISLPCAATNHIFILLLKLRYCCSQNSENEFPKQTEPS